MKKKLTIEESDRLIELGVDPKLASRESLVGGALFTLSDILSILPKEIEVDKERYTLHIHWCVDGDYTNNHQWLVYYSPGFFIEGDREAPELIDALNQLLIWCLTEKKINLNMEKK